MMTEEQRTIFWQRFGAVYAQMDVDLAGHKLLDGHELRHYLAKLSIDDSLNVQIRYQAQDYYQDLIKRGVIEA